MFETPSDLIDAKGGNAVVAKTVGSSEGAVAVWKHRGRIPRASWPELIIAYDDVDLDVLLHIERRAQGHRGSAPLEDGSTVTPDVSDGAEKSEANISRTEPVV